MIDLTNPAIPDLLQKWGHIAEAVKPINKFDDVLELCWWAEYASRCTFLLELGAYAGCSTRAMLLANPDLRIHVIDLWGDNNLAEFITNTEDIGKGRLIFTQGNTHAVLPTIRCPEGWRDFDGLLVDAGHTYGCVKGDLELALPLVCEAALVCGHDYRRDNPEDGVNVAVAERFPQHWNPVMSVWCAYNS